MCWWSLPMTKRFHLCLCQCAQYKQGYGGYRVRQMVECLGWVQEEIKENGAPKEKTVRLRAPTKRLRLLNLLQLPAGTPPSGYAAILYGLQQIEGFRVRVMKLVEAKINRKVQPAVLVAKKKETRSIYPDLLKQRRGLITLDLHQCSERLWVFPHC